MRPQMRRYPVAAAQSRTRRPKASQKAGNRLKTGKKAPRKGCGVVARPRAGDFGPDAGGIGAPLPEAGGPPVSKAPQRLRR